MKLTLCSLVALCAALPLAARDITGHADITAKPRPFYGTGWGNPSGSTYKDGFLRVGYATDPIPGDEDAALRCRRAGAWTFRTSKCDDETLEFLHRYGLKIVFVPDGDRRTCVSNLNRIAKSPYASVLAGIQLGTDPTGGTTDDLVKWRAVAAAAARNLRKVPIALPVRDEKSEIIPKLLGSAYGVTHLIVDFTDTPAPYKRLDLLSRALRDSPDKARQRLKVWLIAPGQAKGLSGATEIAWRMHWVFSAFAVERTDGVFFAQEYRSDDFGLVMRHIWATAAVHPHLMGHGEGAAVEVRAPKPEKLSSSTDEDTNLESNESLRLDDLEEAMATGTAPVACENVVAGRKGDLEYLVLAEKPGVEDDESQMCVAVVNTSGESVEFSVKLKSRTGFMGGGYWRRMVPDPKTGAFTNITHCRGPRRRNEFTETIKPGEIGFLDFRVK